MGDAERRGFQPGGHPQDQRGAVPRPGESARLRPPRGSSCGDPRAAAQPMGAGLCVTAGGRGAKGDPPRCHVTGGGARAVSRPGATAGALRAAGRSGAAFPARRRPGRGRSRLRWSRLRPPQRRPRGVTLLQPAPAAAGRPPPARVSPAGAAGCPTGRGRAQGAQRWKFAGSPAAPASQHRTPPLQSLPRETALSAPRGARAARSARFLPSEAGLEPSSRRPAPRLPSCRPIPPSAPVTFPLPLWMQKQGTAGEKAAGAGSSSRLLRWAQGSGCLTCCLILFLGLVGGLIIYLLVCFCKS